MPNEHPPPWRVNATADKVEIDLLDANDCIITEFYPDMDDVIRRIVEAVNGAEGTPKDQARVVCPTCECVIQEGV